MEFPKIDNPFLSGGLVLMVLGGALAYLRFMPGRIYNFLERFFILKIEVLDEDESFAWVRMWLADRLSNTLSVSVVTKPGAIGDVGVEEKRPKPFFVPAVGTYFFWYKGRPVALSRNRKENSTGSAIAATAGADKAALRTKECFEIRILSRDRSLAESLLEECREKALPADGKLNIRTNIYNYWTVGIKVLPRSLNSVLLEGGQADFLRDDIRKFLDSHGWYQELGVPWRRSYLLYGPPGNGKSSLVKALAGHFGMNLYVLSLNDPEQTDARLMDLLTKVPDGNIVLLEDIDCAFNGRENTGGKDRRLTFSGVLNALDGVASPDGRITFMTTNHLEQLDPALIRAGRADVKVHLDNASRAQAARLFSRFYPESPLAEKFASSIEERKHSMSALQAHLQTHKDSPVAAIEFANQI